MTERAYCCHLTVLFVLSNHRLVMADQPNKNTKEFSMEEVNVWNVEKLQKYLRNCGIAIANDTRKPNLLLKVYHASRLHLPLCSTKEQDDVQISARRKEKLFIDGISLPFPEKLDNWLKRSYHFPDMMMSDMEAYLSKNNNRKSAKEGKNLYERGHVTEVEYNNISDCLKFCYVRGKVVPQTRICGSAKVPGMETFLWGSVGASLGMERAVNMYLRYYIT